MKPVITLFALPFVVLTLGLALFFISMLMLKLTSVLVSGFDIDGFWPLVKATIIVWLVNVAFSAMFDPDRSSKSRRSSKRPGRPKLYGRTRAHRSEPTCMRLDAAITAYLLALEGASRSPETIQNAATYLAAFARAAFDEGDPDVASVEPAHVESWVAEMRSRGLQSSSIATAVSSLSAFLRWCENQGHLRASPMRRVLRPSAASSVETTTPTRRDQLELLLRIARDGWDSEIAGADDRRDQARRTEDFLICALMGLAGLRVSEVCALDSGDVSEREVLVRQARATGGGACRRIRRSGRPSSTTAPRASTSSACPALRPPHHPERAGGADRAARALRGPRARDPPRPAPLVRDGRRPRSAGRRRAARPARPSLGEHDEPLPPLARRRAARGAREARARRLGRG